MPKPVYKPLKPISFEIEYSLLGRKKTVSGYEVVSCLAVDRRDSRWYVTHTPSGMSLVLSEILNFSTRKKAVDYVRNLVRKFPEIDWTVDAGKLTNAVLKALLKRCGGVLPDGGKYEAIKEILTRKTNKNAPQKRGV